MLDKLHYISLRPCLSWHTHAYEYTKMDVSKENNFNTCRKLLNWFVPVFFAIVVAIVSVFCIALFSLYNFIAWVLISSYNQICKLRADRVTPLQPPFIDLDGPLNTIGPDKNAAKSPACPVLAPVHPNTKQTLYRPGPQFPAAFGLRQNHIGYHPQVTRTYPPKFGQTKENSRGSDHSLLDFFLEKGTIPETEMTFWNIIRMAGTDQLYHLLERSDDVFRMLLPSSVPSAKNINAPVLSGDLYYALHTDEAIASKYLYGVLVLLQFWGIQIDQQGCFQKASNFAERVAVAKNNPRLRPHLWRMIKSLGDCGFGLLAQELINFLLIHKKCYGIQEKPIQAAQQYLTHLPHQDSHLHFYIRNCAYLPLSSECKRTTQTLDQTPGWGSHISEHQPGVSPKEQDWIYKSSKRYQKDYYKAPILRWNTQEQRWELPFLEAPRYFCTIEEQKNNPHMRQAFD